MKAPDSNSVSVPATDSPSPIADWARERTGCRLVVLFGSEPRGRTREGSDVDLAVLFDPLPEPRDRLRIIGELQDLASPRAADVVFLRPETDPVLRFEIFRDGECLYEAEEGLFIDERVRAVMLHEDALPFRRALRERLVSGAGSGGTTS